MFPFHSGVVDIKDVINAICLWLMLPCLAARCYYYYGYE